MFISIWALYSEIWSFHICLKNLWTQSATESYVGFSPSHSCTPRKTRIVIPPQTFFFFYQLKPQFIYWVTKKLSGQIVNKERNKNHIHFVLCPFDLFYFIPFHLLPFTMVTLQPVFFLFLWRQTNKTIHAVV